VIIWKKPKIHISSSFNWQNGFGRHFENRFGDYRVIITSTATNQHGEFSIITYVITVLIIEIRLKNFCVDLPHCATSLYSLLGEEVKLSNFEKQNVKSSFFSLPSHRIEQPFETVHRFVRFHLFTRGIIIRFFVNEIIITLQKNLKIFTH
jgi:hypothetical protein